MSETGSQKPDPEINPQSGFPGVGPDQQSAAPTPYSQPPMAPPAPPYGQAPYGQPYQAQAHPPYGQQPYYGPGVHKAPGEGLYVAAAIINWVVFGIIVVATLGIGIITAAWFIPMTIRMHKDARDHTKHTALGVCTLLFCNLVSGILILVADSDRQPA